MTRLSVTLDENTARELEEFPERLHRVRSRLEPEAIDAFARYCMERPRAIFMFVDSLHDLHEEPSAAAVMRQAVRWYLSIAHDIERTALLEEGYAALAEDEERSPIFRFQAARAGTRWADEP
jgi:hypothetical protein